VTDDTQKTDGRKSGIAGAATAIAIPPKSVCFMMRRPPTRHVVHLFTL